MENKLKILQVEDLRSDVILINNTLKKGKIDFEIKVVETRIDFINALEDFSPDLILSDHSLPSFNSHEALAILKDQGMTIPLILITSNMSEEFAVDVMKRGADDYILKDRLERLPSAVLSSMEKYRLEKERLAFLSELVKNEKHYRSLIENINDVIALINEKSTLIYQSPAVKRLTGFVFEELKDKEVFEYVHPDDLESCLALFKNVHGQPGIPLSSQYRVLHKNGHYIWTEGTITNLLDDESVKAIIVNYRDITDRKHAEERVINANRLYSFISQINQTIVRAESEQIVLKEACRIATEIGKFKAAWIGFIDTANKEITYAAGSGVSDKDIARFTNATYKTTGPQQQILQTGTYYVCNNIAEETGIEDWKEFAAMRGYNSFMVLPIYKSGQIIGSFNFYATEIDFFSSAEIALLKEATKDISFALDNFEKDKQRTLTEQRLKHSELRLKQAQAIAHLGNWEINLSNGIGMWSEEALRIYGLPITEIRQSYESWLALIHPDDVERVREVTRQGELALSSTGFFHRIIRKDGTVRHIFCKTQFEFSVTGKPISLYGISHDVTDLKESEKAIQRAKSNLRALIENTDASIYSIDTNFRFITFNQLLFNTLKTLYGLEIKEGDIVFDFLEKLEPEEARQWKKTYSKALKGETVKFEKIFHRGESSICISFSIYPIWDNKEVVGFSCFAFDITKQKLAEEAQVQSELRYLQIVEKAYEEKNIILESIGDGFFAVDKDWKITYWNSQASKMLGRSKESMLGRNLWEAKSIKIDNILYQNFTKAVIENSVQHFESYLESLDTWFEWSAYPSSNGLSIYFKDIMERKLSERNLNKLNLDLHMQAQELAISNKELEQFAYVASHDLQEPLRMVTSFLDRIEKKYGDAIDEKGKQYIHFAVDGAKRMRKIILDLLEFSKVGSIEEKTDNVDVNEILADTISLYRKKIKETNAEIKVGKLPVLQSNTTPLRQVFQNLLSNALKYHKYGIPPLIEISSHEHPDFWEFSVKDNGMGIESEYFDRIFILFQRLHNKDQYSGTGIGLAICKKIINNLGGKIWLQSEAGVGSTFYFTIAKNNTPII